MDEINVDFFSETELKKPMPEWKKYLIIGGVIGAFLLIIIIILVQILKTNEEKKIK